MSEGHSIDEIASALAASWGADTAWEAEMWDPERPSTAQCGASALVVHDLLGGDVLQAEVHRNGERTEFHYWNRLPSGQELDLTRDQFDGQDVDIKEPVAKVRPDRLPDPVRQAQYERLRDRVVAALGRSS